MVGTASTKRVTGKRMMVVMNAGIFGEGGGLSVHLPGTFTTIGNGVGAGLPQPSGISAAPAATPDPVAGEVDENEGFTPPPGWTPEPGTGVPPTRAVPVETDSGDSGTATFVPPPDWTPEPGTGVAPTSASVDDLVGGTGGGTEYVPPPGWTPEPGTGVPPTNSRSSGVQASGVLLVTRTADSAELTETTFEVVAPTSELAQEARARLEELQTQAALGLFADIDIEGYVSSVAPRPVHGVCMATDDGVVCVPLAALQDD